MPESAAHRLLNADPQRPEDGIRQDITMLLNGMGIESLLSYRTSSGPADIYLPRRRVFIETKAVGLVDDPHRRQVRKKEETAFQQVERYLKAEMNDELGRLPLDEQPNLPWTGIVTDGRIWHAWRFPHSYENTRNCVLDSFRPRSEAELLRRIKPIVSAKLVGKPWIPTDPVPIFASALDDLRTIHAQLFGGRVQRATDTKMRLWLDMLRGSGMAPEKEIAQGRLFTAHCFLVALARGVVHTLLKPNVQPDPMELLVNGYLAWIVEVEDGRVWAQELLDRVHDYEWRRTAGDVLRPLYESFVDQDDRKDFGEVYTPDWLAEMMVEEILDEEWCNKSVVAALAELRGQGQADGVGVLDPTCGSGTFLYHCAKRILSSEIAKGLQPGQRSDVVCRLVHGIDIHPVAVEFSQATLLRALPATPSMALAIYQGDALMLRQTDKDTLFEPLDEEVLIRSPQRREIRIPRSFSEHTEFPDMLRRMVDAAAQGAALPADIGPAMGSDGSKIAECHKALTEIIDAEGNSVWTWYITNILGPDRLAQRKVNRIVANPPWVTLANIQVTERKRALEAMAGKDNKSGNLDLWTGGKQAPHFDIAQLFIRYALITYLANYKDDPSAWVTKASAITGGNWNKSRSHHGNFLSQTLDFFDVRVFGGGDARRSCVLFYNKRRSSLGATGDHKTILKATCPGLTPDASLSWREAQSLLLWETPDEFPPESSYYAHDGWRQGATIVPKVLTTVGEVRSCQSLDTKSVTTIRSDKKNSWYVVQPRTGEIPAHWLVPLLKSKQLLPFGIAPAGPETVIIPCNEDGELLSAETARQTNFYAELDDLYRERRSMGSNTPQNLIARINYARALSSQLPLRSQSGCMVIYPASGDIMRAAHISADMAAMDSGLYRRIVDSIAEARYLVAVLNAPCLEKAFRQSRPSGRHFHTNPWKSVPIAAWDEGNSVHQELATLARHAEETVQTMDLPDGQVAASRRIRERLTENGIFGKIDSLVRKILPNHVQRAKPASPQAKEPQELSKDMRMEEERLVQLRAAGLRSKPD